MADDPHAALLSWATSHGATLHPSLEIARDDRSGAGFRVKQGASIAPGDPLATCPMPLTLSYLNALPSPPSPFHHDPSAPLPAPFLQSAPPHVVGRVFLVQQFLRGRDSHWWPYIRSLPQPEDVASWTLPPFWEEDDRELLEGTNLEVSIGKINATLKREFNEAQRLLGEWADGPKFTRALYNWAYAIFTSRSFMPSLVVPGIREQEPPEGVKSWDDFSVLLPLFDIGNHSITARTAWEAEGTACRLVTREAHAAGQQVFNNYGMKTNAQLLLAYGFMVPPTEELHNDYIHIRKRVAPGSEASGGKAQKQTEYLFSLRPMADEASVLGKALQEEPVPPADVFPAFRHVQDGMVLDLAQQILQHNPALNPEGEGGLLARILTADLPRASAQLLNAAVATVQQKALQELEKLDESEVEVDEGQEAELTACQRLAVGYRRRCREVLEGVMESIEESAGDARYVALTAPREASEEGSKGTAEDSKEASDEGLKGGAGGNLKEDSEENAKEAPEESSREAAGANSEHIPTGEAEEAEECPGEAPEEISKEDTP